MSEHDSEKWTGKPAKKLDPVSMGAGAAIATGVLFWAAFWGINREAFGANIMTELFGIVIEVGLVILGVDWLTNRRARNMHANGIREVRLRLVQLVPRSTGHAIRILEFTLDNEEPKEPNFAQRRDSTVQNLDERHQALNALHDTYRIEIQHAPELAEEIRYISKKLEHLITNLKMLPDDAPTSLQGGCLPQMPALALRSSINICRELLRDTLTGKQSRDPYTTYQLERLNRAEIRLAVINADEAPDEPNYSQN